MARRLSQRRERRALWLVTALVLLGHALALSWLRGLLQPPSLLAQVVAPLYTRTITVQTPPPVPEPTAPVAENSASKRPTALIHRAPSAIKTKATKKPQQPASAAQPEATPEPEPLLADAASDIPAADEPTPTPALVAQAAASTPDESGPSVSAPAIAAASAVSAEPASAAKPAFLASWPADTRLAYALGGNYRGELHGSAQVLWQHTGTRYQAVVQIDVSILLSMRMTSQGEITERGLAPEVYEEQVRQRRRGVRIGDGVRLNNGQTMPRPEGVQDTASQFVELSHRFATDPAALKAGSEIRLWLARPGGVDEWTYDVMGEDTLHLPRLGAVPAFHLKPRPLSKPRGPISAEIWIAPTLQYLPVRIRLTQGPDTYMDLLVETIEQR